MKKGKIVSGNISSSVLTDIMLGGNIDMSGISLTKSIYDLSPNQLKILRNVISEENTIIEKIKSGNHKMYGDFIPYKTQEENNKEYGWVAHSHLNYKSLTLWGHYVSLDESGMLVTFYDKNNIKTVVDGCCTFTQRGEALDIIVLLTKEEMCKINGVVGDITGEEIEISQWYKKYSK